jgi:hypothetical protein
MVFLSNAISDGMNGKNTLDDNNLIFLARINENTLDDPVETTIYGTRWASKDIPT